MRNRKFSTVSSAVLTFLMAQSFSSQAQISTSELNGQTINTITTAVPLLMISPDGRAGALGDAGGAMSADANSIHWGAAKLATIEGNSGISLSYIPWLRKLVPDINLGYLSWYKKLKKRQVIGGSLRYFSLGNIIFTDTKGVRHSAKTIGVRGIPRVAN